MLFLEREVLVREARYKDLRREASQERLAQSTDRQGAASWVQDTFLNLGCNLPVLKTVPACTMRSVTYQ